LEPTIKNKTGLANNMKYIVLALVSIVHITVAMEAPCAYTMNKEYQNGSGNKQPTSLEIERCDCCDVMKWGNFLLCQYSKQERDQSAQQSCCGECQMVYDCLESSICLCAPQACLCGTFYAILRNIPISYNNTQTSHADISLMVAALATTTISGYITWRNCTCPHYKKN
jgi:hypothetical protein